MIEVFCGGVEIINSKIFLGGKIWQVIFWGGLIKVVIFGGIQNNLKIHGSLPSNPGRIVLQIGTTK